MSANAVIVGKPSLCRDGWTRTEVCFHGFANLSTTRGEEVESPEFSCFGRQWTLALYPGGDVGSADGYVAIDLGIMSNEAIKIQYGYSIRDAAGKEIVYHEPETNLFDGASDEGDDGEDAWFNSNFARRSTLMDALIEGGTLIIEVRMRLKAIEVNKHFIPDNPINGNILNKFNDEESADILFEVNNTSMNEQGADGSSRKRAKSTTTFHAHRLILQDGASTLAEMCKPSSRGRDAATSVSITDVEPEIFRHILYYLYGGNLTDKEFNGNARDIMNAADKYGIVPLKLQAEVYYIKSTTITLENMIDNLLYADCKNLALLKESVMDYIVANKNDIIGKVSFPSNVPGAMITDILAAVARGEQSEDDDNSNGTIDYNKMRVGTLRKMLHDKGLDVDGSREAMISTLQASGEESE